MRTALLLALLGVAALASADQLGASLDGEGSALEQAEELQVAQLVRVASQVLPGATPCLSRAIVLEALLVSAGHAAELRIGVTPLSGRARPNAHAWVELGGIALAEDPSRYTALPLFGTRG